MKATEGSTIINPPELSRPKGFSHGVLAPPGRLLFVAGQIGWGPDERLVGTDLTSQFDRALENVLAVVRAAGGRPEHIGRFTIYVGDRDEYMRETRSIGEAYRKHMGKHFPAMALVEVARLLEPGAKVEIEATAVLPGVMEQEGSK